MELHQIKKLPHSKESNYQNHRQLIEWKKIFASHLSDIGLIPRTYRVPKLDAKRTSSPINKWANELNRRFSKEVQIANKYVKKCSLSLAIKDANQNYTVRGEGRDGGRKEGVGGRGEK
jgi:hypothetical protein